MKLSLRIAAIGLSVTALLGCASVEVATNHDPEVDFSAYSAYLWVAAKDAGIDYTPQPHLDLRFRRIVDDTLAAKGFEVAVAPPQADLLLVYYAAVDSKLRVTTTPTINAYPYGYGYWPGSTWGYTEARIVHEGTVVLDMVDRATKQVVWTGSVSGVIRSANPPGDRIAKVVDQLLATFPPAR